MIRQKFEYHTKKRHFLKEHLINLLTFGHTTQYFWNHHNTVEMNAYTTKNRNKLLNSLLSIGMESVGLSLKEKCVVRHCLCQSMDFRFFPSKSSRENINRMKCTMIRHNMFTLANLWEFVHVWQWPMLQHTFYSSEINFVNRWIDSIWIRIDVRCSKKNAWNEVLIHLSSFQRFLKLSDVQLRKKWVQSNMFRLQNQFPVTKKNLIGGANLISWLNQIRINFTLHCPRYGISALKKKRPTDAYDPCHRLIFNKGRKQSNTKQNKKWENVPQQHSTAQLQFMYKK